MPRRNNQPTMDTFNSAACYEPPTQQWRECPECLRTSPLLVGGYSFFFCGLVVHRFGHWVGCGFEVNRLVLVDLMRSEERR